MFSELTFYFIFDLTQIPLKYILEILKPENVFIINVFNIARGNICEFLELIQIVPDSLGIILGASFENLEFSLIAMKSYLQTSVLLI